MFQVKIIHNILPTQPSLFHQCIIHPDVCPLRNLQSQSLKHMISTCTVFSSFWTCFPYWWQEIFNQNWLYLRAPFYTVGTKSQIIKKFLITAWLSPNNVFATSEHNSILDFDSFLLRFKNKIYILRTIAFRSNCLQQCKNKINQTSVNVWMLVSFPWYIFL